MTERSGVITFQGKPLTLIGPALKVGSEAPHFVLTANDLSDLRCDAYHGKVLVLSVVPSLDTPVCATHPSTDGGGTGSRLRRADGWLIREHDDG